MAKQEQVRTPRRVKSQILPRWTSPESSRQTVDTPATPEYQRFPLSVREEAVQVPMAPDSGSRNWSWLYGMQPGAVNPYAYYGGFWPGLSYVQDPSWAYHGYTTPTHVSQVTRSPNDNDHLATPTHAHDSPSGQVTRARRG
jgi:hypothetical protein